MGAAHLHRRVARAPGEDLRRPGRLLPTLTDRDQAPHQRAHHVCGRTRRPARSPPRCRSASRSQRRSSSVRMVVAPSRFRQNAAKSCSPSRCCAGGVHRVEVERPRPGRARGRGPAGPRAAAGRRPGRRSGARPRRTARRSRPEPRVMRWMRTSGPSTPLSRRRTASSGGSSLRPARPSRRSSARSTWATCPRACTPASVRPATVSAAPRVRSTVSSACSRSPCTVRSPDCRAHPWKPVPS